VIDGHADAGSPGELRKSLDLGSTDDLIGYQDIAKTVVNQHFGLTELGTCHSDRARQHLALCQSHALVILKVRTQFGWSITKEACHPGEVSVAGCSIQQQCGRIQFFNRPPDPRVLFSRR